MSGPFHERLRGGLIHLVLVLVGCTAFEELEFIPEVPPDVRLVYAAVQRSDGSLELTPLEPWPGSKFELNGRSDLARWLIGYSSPPPMVEAAVHRQLRPASLCEPALPPGTWCQVIGDGSGTEAEPCVPSERPAVTFEGLEAFRRCEGGIAVRVACGGQQVDCEWILEHTDCSYQVSTCSLLPRFSLSFDGIARVCDVEVPSGCSLGGAPGALRALSCPSTDEACTAEVHVVPGQSWLTVSQRIPLVDAEPRVPEASADGSFTTSSTLKAGFTYDFALAGGLIFVALPTLGGVVSWSESHRAGTHGSLVRVVAADGRSLAESDIYPEPTVALEAVGNDVVALMEGSSPIVRLRRFDGEARLVAEAQIARSALGLPGAIRTAALTSDGTRIFASLSTRTPDPVTTVSVLLEIDPVTLSTVAIARFPAVGVASDARRIVSIAKSGDRILAEDESTRTHVWFDASTLEPITEVAMEERYTDDASLYAIGDLGIVSRLGPRRPGMDLVSFGRSFATRVVRFSPPGPATAVGPWPGNLDWASAASYHDFGAHVGPVDLANGQVLLGAAPAGFGPAHRIRSDGGLGLWVLLPWSGQLARLTLQ